MPMYESTGTALDRYDPDNGEGASNAIWLLWLIPVLFVGAAIYVATNDEPSQSHITIKIAQADLVQLEREREALADRVERVANQVHPRSHYRYCELSPPGGIENCAVRKRRHESVRKYPCTEQMLAVCELAMPVFNDIAVRKLAVRGRLVAALGAHKAAVDAAAVEPGAG